MARKTELDIRQENSRLRKAIKELKKQLALFKETENLSTVPDVQEIVDTELKREPRSTGRRLVGR